MNPRGRDDDESLPFDVVIPDDLSALAEEVRAVQWEQRWRRRRTWLRRRLTGRWHRHGLSGPLVALILAVVALVGGLLALFTPRSSGPPQQRPLARDTRARPGDLGGLLPATEVVVRGLRVNSRDLRPAVLVFVPAACAAGAIVPETCRRTLEEALREAGEYRLEVYLVGVSGQETALRQVATSAAGVAAGVVIDLHGTLSAAYRPEGVTTVLVDGTGVVTAVERNLRPGLRLEPRLSRLVAPGAGT